MVKQCFISGCQSKNECGKMSLFSPPKGSLEIWQNCIPKARLQETSRVCSRHFDEDDIVKGKIIQDMFYPFGRWRLKSGALPKHFLSGPRKRKPLSSVTQNLSNKKKSKQKSRNKNILVCSVPNCCHSNELNIGPEPNIFHNFPSDPYICNRWVKALENVNWIPKDKKGKVCSAHFKPEDYEEINPKVLRATAVPSLNMKLKAVLSEPNPVPDRSIDESKQTTIMPSSNEDFPIENRKRFSNVIVVDLVKENKKLKCSGRLQLTNPSAENGCSTCLEKDKNLREVEFQLALAKEELEGQKKLVEEQMNLVEEQKKLLEEQNKLIEELKKNSQT